MCPAFNLTVQLCTLPDADDQATVIIQARVPPDSARIVPLERRPPELDFRNPRDVQPKLLCRRNVTALVYTEAAYAGQIAGPV